MQRRRFLSGLPALLWQQTPDDTVWLCPMDKDVRAAKPGVCPRCGVKLVPGIPEPLEYRMLLDVTPRAWKPGQRLRMRFEIRDPRTDQRVMKLQVIHERLFHLFIVSGDLSYFAHEHPEPQADGTLVFDTALPHPGFYRVVGDFYPEGGTPQLAVTTILSAGSGQIDFATPRLAPQTGPQTTANLRVSLRSEPPVPIAGLKTMLFFDLQPADGLQLYLGAWGHMLAASADLIDLIHTHPFLADGGPNPQFNIVFPRPGLYRIWVQFQRLGIVNTAVFTLPVRGL
ncbi:heavy metal-binding domain-containing protein [uncultured Paludibaculum sp.]|uniref:heavy metal-binding domain-containing protein n=1 Tax=uncultured Paludibaculum sp. TaxID=1765020 RepID=UPI002AAAFC0A|nr:heavy metal-binding domain-containing protein [uncultured Paludibaculum sp.]